MRSSPTKKGCKKYAAAKAEYRATCAAARADYEVARRAAFAAFGAALAKYNIVRLPALEKYNADCDTVDAENVGNN